MPVILSEPNVDPNFYSSAYCLRPADPGRTDTSEARSARRSLQAVDVRTTDAGAEEYDPEPALERARRHDDRAVQCAAAKSRNGRYGTEVRCRNALPLVDSTQAQRVRN